MSEEIKYLKCPNCGEEFADYILKSYLQKYDGKCVICYQKEDNVLFQAKETNRLLKEIIQLLKINE